MPRQKWRGTSELFLGTASDGSEVVVRQNGSHLAGVDSSLIVEALENIDASRLPTFGVETYTHDFREQVGWIEVVATNREDRVFYAPRTDTSGGPRYDTRTGLVRPTRWVQGVAKPKATQITFGLLRARDGKQLVLIFAAFGPPTRLEPGDPRAGDEDRRWWFDPDTGLGHAFVSPLQHFDATDVLPDDFRIRE